MTGSALKLIGLISLVLLWGFVLLGWVRSHLWGDALRHYDQPRMLDVMSVDGLLAASWGTLESVNYPPPPGWEGSFWPFERRVHYIEADLGQAVGGTTFGFAYRRDQRASVTMAIDMATMVFPWWFVALIAATLSVYPVIRLAAVSRRKRNISAGRCAACGYDLRASLERCPECGETRVPAAGNE